MSKKNPYVAYTEQEVARIEGNFYVLLFGGDFVYEDGEYLFTKKEVIKIHKKMLKDLIDITRNGSEKDSRYALDLIAGLVIKPMRLH